MTKKPKVVIIVGPTSSGKTALSLALAKKFNGEIISADSRQVYRGFKLLSGAVTKKEMDGIKHHLLQIADPKTTFTVSDYQKLALAALADIVAKKKLPIIVGGSGFYIDSLLYQNTLPEVPPNKKLRTELSKLSTPELAARLKQLDQGRYQNIDQHNPVRLIRAIEIAEALGYVPERKIKLNPNYDFLIIYLKPNPAILAKKILSRLKDRLKKGMVNETKKLLATKSITKKRLRQLGLEFKWTTDYLDKLITKEELLDGLLAEHLKYVKRQHTWFKKYPKTITPKKVSEVNTLVKTFLSL